MTTPTCGALWDDLVKWTADDKSYTMACSFIPAAAENGLIVGHSYTVLSAKEADGQKLVRFRNPWGKDGEWKGDWSDESTKWDAATKKDFGWVDANDGAFFMDFTDVVKLIQQVVVSDCSSQGGR